MRAVIIFVVLCFDISCGSGVPEGFDLPDECSSKCEVAGDMNSLRDAVANSAAQFSNCICLKSGEIEGDITISKSLSIIGRSDGTSKLKRLTISKAENVLISNVVFSDIVTTDAAVNIFESSVKMENVKISQITAGSLFGGRGIVVSGGKSKVELTGSTIEKTDGTGILINGLHEVTIKKSKISECGFAGVWMQNQSKRSGFVIIENSTLSNNAAVAVEILGNSFLNMADSVINGVEQREITQNIVGDGIVVKNRLMSEVKGAVIIKNTAINDFERAGIIFDGENGDKIAGVTIQGLNLISKKGEFGVVVQNGLETEGFRNGILINSFLENDLDLTEPLFIVTTVFETE